MSSKRAKAKELKQKKKQRKQITIIGLIAGAALIVLTFGLYGLNQFNKSYVMTFEGKRVSVNDFRFTLISTMNSESEDHKSEAFDLLLETLVLISRGEAEGVELTDDDKGNMLSWAGQYKSQFTSNYGMDMSFITTERVAEILSTEVYFENLMQKYTVDLVIDEEELEQAFQEYKENNKTEYYDMQFKYAYNLDREALETARNEVEEGNLTFDELVETQSVLYDAEEGIQTWPLSWIDVSKEDAERLAAMEVGEMSDVMETESNYPLIVQVESKEIPADEDLMENFRESYELRKRQEAFKLYVDEWKKEADYTVNQKGYDAA
jgi:hypothetical protein